MHVAPDGLRTVRQDGIVARVRDARPDGLRPCRSAQDRLVRDVARATLRSRPLGLRHRRRDDLRLRATPAGHPVRSGIPCARRGPDAPVRDLRTSVARRLPARRTGAGCQRRPAHRAGLRGPLAGRRPADRRARPSRRRTSPAGRDQGRDVADVLVRHDPGPDGRAERLHHGLVRRAALGLVTRGRMAIEWEDDVEILSRGRHLPLPGRTAGPSHRGGRPGDLPRPHARRRVRGRGAIADWRRGTAARRPAADRAGSRWPRWAEAPARLVSLGSATPSPASGSERS